MADERGPVTRANLKKNMKNNGNGRLATSATGEDYRQAWLDADAALQKLQTMTRVGDKVETEIVLARQKIAASQSLVWDAEPKDAA
jgi:hypothetical protein